MFFIFCFVVCCVFLRSTEAALMGIFTPISRWSAKRGMTKGARRSVKSSATKGAKSGKDDDQAAGEDALQGIVGLPMSLRLCIRSDLCS